MQKQIFTTLFFLGFTSLACASTPPGWMKLASAAPNVETYASLDNEKPSYVALQKHEMSAKLSQLKEKLAANKAAITFSDYKAANVDRAGSCYSMNLESTREPASVQRRLRETWCFDKKFAWAVVESGMTRVEADFVTQMLQSNGYKGSAK